MNLSKIFKSEILAKIIILFHQHPSSIDTSRGIATWLGHDEKGIERALEELVKLKILVAHRTSSTVGYAYTHDKEIISKVAKFIKKKGIKKMVFFKKGKLG